MELIPDEDRTEMNAPDLQDGTCPRCRCGDTAFDYGVYICSCCGCHFISEEAERKSLEKSVIPCSPASGEKRQSRAKVNGLLSLFKG